MSTPHPHTFRIDACAVGGLAGKDGPLLVAETKMVIHQPQTIEDDFGHDLHNATLGSLAAGPAYTFQSGWNCTTTVDYVITNRDSFRGIEFCVTLEDHPLNTSDHLPIKCSLDISHISYPTSPASPTSPLDWDEGKRTLQTSLYATDDICQTTAWEGFWHNWWNEQWISPCVWRPSKCSWATHPKEEV